MSNVTVTGQKGGIGKTTTAITIAHGLAHQGKRVLLVDLDSQAHSSVALGRDPEPGIFNLIVGEQPLGNCVRSLSGKDGEGRPGLYLLPGDSRTKTVEAVMRAEPDSIYKLTTALSHLHVLGGRELAQFGGWFDVVVFDTAASGILQEVAMRVADQVVMPTRTEALAVDGMEKNLMALSKLRPDFSNYLILPTAFDERLREHNYQLGQLRVSYNGAVCDPVPARTAVAEAQAYGRTVWEFNRDGSADVRLAYTKLLERLDA